MTKEQKTVRVDQDILKKKKWKYDNENQKNNAQGYKNKIGAFEERNSERDSGSEEVY